MMSLNGSLRILKRKGALEETKKMLPAFLSAQKNDVLSGFFRHFVKIIQSNHQFFPKFDY
jgi:hypothetical protein